jgi:hypothetical protein
MTNAIILLRTWIQPSTLQIPRIHIHAKVLNNVSSSSDRIIQGKIPIKLTQFWDKQVDTEFLRQLGNSVYRRDLGANTLLTRPTEHTNVFNFINRRMGSQIYSQRYHDARIRYT